MGRILPGTGMPFGIQMHPLLPLPGHNLPTDPDGDGLYEDINGDEEVHSDDVDDFFEYFEWIEANEPIGCFDFNGNGIIDYADIVKLDEEV
jgi:PKD repeat protein